ncbi:MAG: TonB-dependent receptor [Bacteroides sp.]|nr:TonB-dependent receptor [Bacteroides sp.]
MKQQILGCCLMVMAASVSAQMPSIDADTLRVIDLQEVEVVSTRATKTTPVAYTNIGKEELKERNVGQDLPYLLSMTPSALTTSDAGAGIGYTTIRVRGTDGTRINVTANGIPVNDAESHNVFWVNLPDFASSVKDMQVQRGAGTSTNGAGAFGASINMQTGELAMEPYAEFNGSYGSFNTHKETFKVGTGLIKDHWAFDLRLSDIGTDGYIDRASVGLNSYYLQGAYYADNTSIKFIAFAGREKTYHAWNYASKEEMELYGRKYNSCGYMYTAEDGTMHFYDDQTDNYTQKNYQLLFNHTFTPQWNLNIGLHYTKGDGYYQEYKTNRKLVEYALQPFQWGDEWVKKSDLVRKKAMDNGFGGGIFSVNYRNNRLNASLGGGLNHYDGHHFGRVLWVKNYQGEVSPDHEYYRNKGTKTDGNIYLKADYGLTDKLNVYADMQYRHIDYRIKGTNDKWNSLTDEGLQQLDIDERFDFFNPKVGLSWQINRNSRLFGSFSVAHKEPTRNNYTDGKLFDHPKSERLMDYELGYTYANSWLNLGANLYYMDYKDQLVLTGELNEIGEPLAANMPDSYRMGVELMAGIRTNLGLSWDINATWSRNRIQNFTETLYENEDVSGAHWEINHGDTPIAFSPDFLVNNTLSYRWKSWEASLQSQYVSKQYLNNACQEDQTLDAYFVSNLRLAYTFKLPFTKEITAGLTVFNLFNEEYENNGYAGSGFYYDGGEKVRYNYAGYAAQAGTNVLGHLTIRF